MTEWTGAAALARASFAELRLTRSASTALFFVCAIAAAARADEASAGHGLPAQQASAPEQPEWGDGRVIDGHVFPFPQFMPSSFVVSSFGVRAGLELRKVPNFAATPLSGDATSQSVDLSTAAASEAIDASVRVHRLLAIWFSGYGTARVGTNSKTILGTGGDFELGGDLGVLLRLVRTRNFQLSARAAGGYYGGKQAGIDRFYQSVRELADKVVRDSLTGSASFDEQSEMFRAALFRAASEIVTSTSGFRTSMMLTAAQAVGPYVGLQGAVGVSFDRGSDVTSDYDVDEDETVRLSAVDRLIETTVGLAIDVGGGDGRGWPLDLVLEYLLLPMRIERDAGVDSYLQKVIAHRVAVDLFYSGRTDLQLGASFYTLLAQARQVGVDGELSGRPHQNGGAFIFRYIW